MTNKKKNTIIIVGVILLAIIIGMICLLPKINFNSTVGALPPEATTREASKDFEQQENENMQESLLVYADYGLTYDAETQKLYYEGQLIKKFTDGKLIYIEQAEGTVNVTAVRDNEGNLIGIKIPD